MRWMSYIYDGNESFGVATSTGVVDAASRLPGVATLKDLLAAGTLDAAGAKLSKVRPDYAFDEIEFLPVITRPDKILCVGLNYKAHQEETGRDPTDHPTIFVRFASAQIGHEQPMVRPVESERLDYEGEIALVIGRRGRRIKREAALAHIAGFSCYNDGSVRDYQRHTTQFTPGKNFVGTGPFGPWMMTPAEVGDPRQLEITTRLNGEVMQHSKAELLIFDFAELIAYCSTFTELVPGDVIVTGTPGGVGAARNPPVFLQAGDVVEVEVKPIGTLRNTVVVG
jgi:2-keto-4-pentenoate hydratase/2-oxohepta-3-ene-1,7-dioic acid hydratase in catechol pathway